MPGEVGEVTGPGGLGPRPGPADSAIAPTVDAGGPYDGTIDLPTSLDATVVEGSDSSPTLLWEILSGGTGTFSDDSIEDPTFTPDATALYTLRLTVTPSDSSAVSDSATLQMGGASPFFTRRRRRR